MQLLYKFYCILCLNRYDDTRKPCLGSCTHTICLVCKNNRKTANCPICKGIDAFKEQKINYSALEAVKELGETVDLHHINAFIADEKLAGCGPCSECSEYTEKLRLCIDCSVSNGDIRKVGDDYVMAVVREEASLKFLQLRSLSMCSHCAIERAHEGHKTMLLVKALRPHLQNEGPPEEMIKNFCQLLRTEFDEQEFKQKHRTRKSVTFHPPTVAAWKALLGIERAQKRQREERLEKERWNEMFNLMNVQFLDLTIPFLELSTEREKVEMARAEINCKFKCLTVHDVSRFNEQMLKRMKELGSEEQLKKATEHGLEMYWIRKREVDVAREIYRKVRQMKLPARRWKQKRMQRKRSNAYLAAVRRLVEAENEMITADWQHTLNLLTQLTIQIVRLYLCHLRPLFGKIPFRLGIMSK